MRSMGVTLSACFDFLRAAVRDLEESDYLSLPEPRRYFEIKESATPSAA